MTIELSSELETRLRDRAESAGFDTVSEYIQQLVEADEQQAEWLRQIAARPELERLALEGLNSGPAQPLDMPSIRDEVRKRLTRES